MIDDFRIGTLGSHSALQILKGAKDEGFQSVVICRKGTARPYQSFKVADQIIEVDDFKDILQFEQQLVDENVILVPHGSLVNALGLDGLDQLRIKYFGNKGVLTWEENRDKQRQWLHEAGLKLPRIYAKPEDIDGPVIIKFHGAVGGRGYFLAKNSEDFYRKIAEHPNKKYIIQEYIVGAPMYIHYFYSPLNNELEVMSFDRRYETNVDSIGRIGARDQMDLELETSYTIIGNTPVVVRESLLPEIFEMGERVVEVSRKLTPGGLIGPFCLETIITPDLEFVVFEISARIVGGVNPYTNGSPYSDLRYNEPMSTGRRIAREIKTAIEQNKLKEVLSNGEPN